MKKIKWQSITIFPTTLLSLILFYHSLNCYRRIREKWFEKFLYHFKERGYETVWVEVKHTKLKKAGKTETFIFFFLKFKTSGSKEDLRIYPGINRRNALNQKVRKNNKRGYNEFS